MTAVPRSVVVREAVTLLAAITSLGASSTYAALHGERNRKRLAKLGSSRS